MKLGRYWKGKWPYCPTAGVGLKMEGVPTDHARFIEILQNESCNPVAAHITLQALLRGEPKFTTVTTSIKFIELIEDLATVGVTMTIVPPRDQQGDLCQIYSLALQIALGKRPGGDPALLAEAEKRAQLVTIDPSTLGPYSHAAE